MLSLLTKKSCLAFGVIRSFWKVQSQIKGRGILAAVIYTLVWQLRPFTVIYTHAFYLFILRLDLLVILSDPAIL